MGLHTGSISYIDLVGHIFPIINIINKTSQVEIKQSDKNGQKFSKFQN